MDQNNLFRQRIQDYQSKVSEETEWWAKKKEDIKQGFLKELDAEEKPATTTTSTTTTTTTTANTNTKTNATAERKTESTAPAVRPPPATVSDDDGVLVEAEVPKVTSGTSSVKKKKKGKK
jgi:translocation protein SEC66